MFCTATLHSSQLACKTVYTITLFPVAASFNFFYINNLRRITGLFVAKIFAKQAYTVQQKNDEMEKHKIMK